ncbi:MAG: signal peptidase I [Fimbriimonadaceae bacterium]|nr:signal peptidase I [Chitinophagales bacterium]
MGFWIFSIISIVGVHVGLYKLFEKAGIAGWKAFVPFYNYYLCVKLIGKPVWWFLLLFVPIVNAVMIFLIATELVKAYGKDGFWAGVASMMIPQFYYPFIGFDKKVKYLGPPHEVYKGKKKTFWREWADAIAFAVIAATFIRTFFFEAYTIPTTSMESTLLAGDFLFVSKFHYGPRFPMTPVAFPFAHHTMPFIGGKAYSEIIKLPYFRLPGLQNIHRNDIVVFNFPEGDTVYLPDPSQDFYDYKRQGTPGRPFTYRPDQITTRPLDKRENYIKRCVAIPGDSLKVVNGVLYINGELAYQPENLQKSYTLYSKPNVVISDDFLVDQGVDTLDREARSRRFYEDRSSSVVVSLTQEIYEKLKPNPAIDRIEPTYYPNSHSDVSVNVVNFQRTYPHNLNVQRNSNDEFGPIYVPKKGETVAINKNTYPFYKRIIESYEHNKISYDKEGNPYINNQPLTEYTFKQNYYWLMGDNRHRSLDSRYWGFVPEDHVVGKAEMVWWSWNSKVPFFQRFGTIRWDRVMRFV